jgi:hypothetical protein
MLLFIGVAGAREAPAKNMLFSLCVEVVASYGTSDLFWAK